MTTPTQPASPRPPSERMHDVRYSKHLNVFCVKCQTNQRRAGGTLRAGMFVCAGCK